MVHRNTYICGPKVLLPTWQTRHRADLLFAGQVSGVEGYVESAASGLIAGRNAAAIARGEAPQAPPRTTAIGSLAYYVSHADPKTISRPTSRTASCRRSINPPRDKMKKKLLIAERALADLDAWTRRSVGDRRLIGAGHERAPQGVSRVPQAQSPRVAAHRCAPTRPTSRSISPGWRAKPARRCRRSRPPIST